MSSTYQFLHENKEYVRAWLKFLHKRDLVECAEATYEAKDLSLHPHTSAINMKGRVCHWQRSTRVSSKGRTIEWFYKKAVKKNEHPTNTAVGFLSLQITTSAILILTKEVATQIDELSNCFL